MIGWVIVNSVVSESIYVQCVQAEKKAQYDWLNLAVILRQCYGLLKIGQCGKTGLSDPHFFVFFNFFLCSLCIYL